MQDAHLECFLSYTPKHFARLYTKLLSFHMHILSCANFELPTLNNNNCITWSRRWRSSACKRGNKIHIRIWFWSSKKTHTLTNYFSNWHTNSMEQQYTFSRHIAITIFCSSCRYYISWLITKFLNWPKVDKVSVYRVMQKCRELKLYPIRKFSWVKQDAVNTVF